MQTINNGYRGLSLLVGLNLDRLIVSGAMVAALMLGAFVSVNLAI
ncbi:hypothetical protein [Falsihalocynthiibacter arcticus]|nr:hypothetical protein [Falsihalocynthiibacter arcticus]